MPNSTNTQKSNVDQEEIAKFEAIAHRWWDPDSEFRPLHQINPLRLGFIDKIVGLSDKKVLDVGCGGGLLSEAMALRGAHVVGIDMGETPIQVAKLHSAESGVTVDYVKTSAETLAADSKDTDPLFDVITCMEMLEHVPDPAVTIHACMELLKPDGHLFLSTINRNPKSFLFAIVGAEYVLKLLPEGTHDYAKFIKPSELAAWVRQAGASVKEITGLSYNPLTQKYRLANDVGVNYMVHATRTD